MIEALCAAPFTEEKENLRAVEAEILTKRVELSKFESEYREVPTLTCAAHIPILNLYFCYSFGNNGRSWHNLQR